MRYVPHAPGLGLIALVACIMGCVCYLAAIAAVWSTQTLPRLRELPAREPAPAALLLVSLAGALVGSLYATHGAGLPALVRLGLCLGSLAYGLVADLRVSRVPAVVMLPLLALALGATLVAHETANAMAAVVVLLPLGIAVALTRGRGLGLGDVEIAALGALALTPVLGAMALATAFFLAAGVSLFRRPPGARTGVTVALSPYLAATIAISLVLPMLVV